MSKPLMCHVVAGYPGAADCLKLMKGMDQAGAAAIEVQIPFSDPIADGETIMQANDVALEAGMTTSGSFDLIKRARGQGVSCDIYIMSYFQKLQKFGLEAFCRAAHDSDVQGLIIPDLPYDSPEYPVLRRLAHDHDLLPIPVLSPGMPDARLKAVLALESRLLYVTSQRGITGNAYAMDSRVDSLIAQIKAHSKTARIMIGFGISSRTDVFQALKLADVAVVGSAVVKQLQAGGVTRALALVTSLIGAAR